MNRETYKHMLSTYGRVPAEWLGLITELIRTGMQRVWVAIIAAQIATDLASRNLVGARQQVLVFVVVYAVAAAIGAVGDLISIRMECGVYARLAMAYYHKLIGKDMSFYRDTQTGYLVSLYRQYLDSLLVFVRLLRIDVTKMIVSLAAPIIVLFIADWKLGLVVSGVVFAQLIYVFWSSSRANYYRHWSHEIYRKATGEVSDQITNIVAFKSGGIETRATEKLKRYSLVESDAYWRRRKIVTLLDLPREIVTACGVALAFYVVLSGNAVSARSVGLIMLTLTYMFQIVRSVADLPNLMMQHDELVTKLAPTLPYLENSHENINDPQHPRRLKIVHGTIEIKHMSFSYPEREGQTKTRNIFTDLNLCINGGEQVGIVGLSGAGKSTLVSLILRFDDVSSGSIQIDGLDIRKVRQSELHQKIAYVPQEPLLFHNTIRENIAYFKDDASDEDIVQAAEAAHARGFIEKLPRGYDTIVGERGIKLSGGQKQRIVIARAVLKNAPIMIFDEATSALDTESEKIIQSALPRIIGKHTAIVIAHRLSTIADLDRIIVMDNGRIVESGKHNELVLLGGKYAALWEKQVAGR